MRHSEPHQRYPRWVFDEGTEPDPRFSLANERTFLAWIRTAMAFIAAGVAFHAVSLDISESLKLVISVILLLAGILMPLFAWFKRGKTERALRTSKRLSSSLPEELLVAVTLLVVGVLLGIGMFLA